MADSKCGAVMESVMLVAPVTALEFLGEDYLLAGEGPNLSVYSLHAPPAVCATLTALRNQRIHGVRPDPWQQGRAARAAVAEEEEDAELEASPWQREQGRRAALSEEEEEEEEEPSPWRQSGGVRSAVLAVFGGKAVRLVGFEEGGGRGVPLSAGPGAPAGAAGLGVRRALAPGRGSPPGRGSGPQCRAPAGGGKGRSLALRSCREGCLLYSALLLGQHWDHVVVVGGTVFNQLVMWRPGGGGAGRAAEQGAPVERGWRGTAG
ncbi:hypothetical protein ANANG_G00217410 [Anguilla anguilla]|uniref:Uncharacterized protein n=1 Tax=Anguilla anguilla TaxID=7936 RepID=A0A9D3RPR2_ANGAN|nr:hypothetical protein ANANG_G00217410 [Anguilla anguilla]